MPPATRVGQVSASVDALRAARVVAAGGEQKPEHERGQGRVDPPRGDPRTVRSDAPVAAQRPRVLIVKYT